MSETKLLSEIATLQYGGAFSSKEFNVEGKGLPLVRIRDVQRGYSETYFDGLYDEKYIVSDGDFLISMDGNFNLGQWQGGKALLNQRVCLIRDTSDEIDLRYLVAILPRYLAEIEARTPFVTVKHLSAKALNAIEIPIPDLQEQNRIADHYFLQKLIKQKRERQQELFEDFKASLFKSMFEDENEVVHLGDVASFTGGSSLPPGKPFTGQEGGILLMKVSDMNTPGNETEIRQTALWIPEYVNDKQIVPAGSVVIPKRGASIATNKKRITTRPTILDPNLMAIVPLSEKLSTYFLYHWFLQFNLASITSGSSIPQLNKKDLSPLIIKLPKYHHQQKFTKILNTIRN